MKSLLLAQRYPVDQNLINPFHTTSLSIPNENIRKPVVFWYFQGAKKETIGMSWVKSDP